MELRVWFLLALYIAGAAASAGTKDVRSAIFRFCVISLAFYAAIQVQP